MQRTVSLIVFIISVLAQIHPIHAKEEKYPDYLKYVDEITNDFTQDIQKKYKLYCYGSGGSMPTDVEKIEVFFISYNHLTVEEARRIAVNATQELLEKVNKHEKIRPYLREYPFKPDRIGLLVSVRTKTDNRPADGSVAIVTVAENKIFYESAEMRMSKPMRRTIIHDKNNWTTEEIPGKLKEELVPILEESYDEALKIVTNGKKS